MGKPNSQFLIVANLFCNVYILSQRLIWINIYCITPAILRLRHINIKNVIKQILIALKTKYHECDLDTPLYLPVTFLFAKGR